MIEQCAIDVRTHIEATLPGECLARGVPAPAEYHMGLPTPTMVQRYPACVIDLDSGGVGGEGYVEIGHRVIVAVLDRDGDFAALNGRLYRYVDAIIAALDGRRFGSVLMALARRHDSSDLFNVGDGRAVRMRWVEFSVQTLD